jgi:hypothetical protein
MKAKARRQPPQEMTHFSLIYTKKALARKEKKKYALNGKQKHKLQLQSKTESTKYHK